MNDIILPKWPALVVTGKPVTEDQAIEIIFRTHSSYLANASNDVNFNNYISTFLSGQNKWKQIPELYYMCNHQISTAWIGGPHGWINWEGQIFTNNYNIGKWPSVEEVQLELSSIAKAFPFLDMKVQLMSGETCEKDNKPLVQFNVKNGKVKSFVPKNGICSTVCNNLIRYIMQNSSFEHITTWEFERYYNRFKEIMDF